MGTRMAPSYANFFMGKFAQHAIETSLFKQFVWWRFFEDAFTIWTEGKKHLKVTPYSYLARGDWILKWCERAQFSN